MILITHMMRALFERKRDSSSLSLSLCEQKHVELTERESQSTKKTFATYLFISVVSIFFEFDAFTETREEREERKRHKLES